MISEIVIRMEKPQSVSQKSKFDIENTLNASLYFIGVLTKYTIIVVVNVFLKHAGSGVDNTNLCYWLTLFDNYFR